MPSKTGKALSLTKIPKKKSNKDAIAKDTNDTNNGHDKDTNRRYDKDAEEDPENIADDMHHNNGE